MLLALSLLTKTALYIGLLGAAGLAVQKLVFGADHRRMIFLCATMLACAAGLRLFLLNAELAGGLSHVFDFSMFGWVWAPNKSQSLAYLAGAYLLSAAALTNLKPLFGLGAIVLFAGAGLGGHTYGLEAPGLNPAIVSLHIGVAAFWVTAPLVLWPRQGISDVEILRRVKRFSAFAAWSVPLLFAGGLWLSLRLAGTIEALGASAYGRLLIVKFSLAAAALAIGAANKFWVTAKLKQDAAAGRALLQRMLMIDAALFAGVIVAIAAATTLTGPGV